MAHMHNHSFPMLGNSRQSYKAGNSNKGRYNHLKSGSIWGTQYDISRNGLCDSKRCIYQYSGYYQISSGITIIYTQYGNRL